MSSCSNLKSTEVQCLSHRNASPDVSGSPLKPEEEDKEVEEDEEEDVDFNPFLKETPSPEASSSLSSEIEELDGDVVDSAGNICDAMGTYLSKLTGKVQNCVVGDSEHGEEEVVMQSTLSPGRACERELKNAVPRRPKKRKSDIISEQESETVLEKENGSSSGIVVNDVVVGELSNSAYSRKPIMQLDDEDAICMRTRARYSLASFTLDELEAFLQETDDDDDLQNVDDEEEYRKFLAAVLQGRDGDGLSPQENENVDDEDEDNDADFEIELEEALESDLDEGTTDKTQREEYDRAGRRPETRQNRRQKSSAQYKKKLLDQSKRPLRPLIPILPNGPVAPLPTLDGKTWTPETASSCPPSAAAAEDGLINGFTPYQVGQLHCLIHEHVQLLIQIFSLCVLDPSRQHIASQVQGLIFEVLHKRDEVTACRNEPYPVICFRLPHVCSSVPDELPQFGLAQCTSESSATFDAQGVCSPPTNQIPVSQNISPSKGRCECLTNGQVGSFQNVERSFWVPFISGPVLSVLDVAPLNLVGRYMDDVYTAVREYRRRHVESSCDTRFEREPLFPLPCLPSLAESNSEVLKGKTLPAANTVPSSPSKQPPRKTLAATLIESTKKQSVALVPKEITKLMQRFFPLFNPSLFPHKPPPMAVANRVLFTDAEDELLALGLMEYNSDWKAIQQRFLPCKSKHQIFVRQKNRCSSKAPENPIKAVRRMKMSPLTAEEMECIQEGLKVFKLDWMSVWKFVVPHRDPSLLPRQWRIALGTQRSYKQDAAKKERRRLYESKRRQCKTANLAHWQLSSDREDAGENNSGDDYIDNAGEAYVHEAFLADWRPGNSNLISSEHPCLKLREKNLPNDVLLREGTHVKEQPNNYGPAEAQLPIGNMHEFPHGLNYPQHPSATSHFTHVGHCTPKTKQPNHPASDMTLNASKSGVCLWPYRARRSNNPRLVKLAPDLPPVNLPPSVRVISQFAFKGDQCGASTKVFAAGVGVSTAGMENIVPRLPHVAKSTTTHPINARKDKSNSVKENVTNSQPEESGVTKDKRVIEERGTDSDLQMHPLLFRAPEDGRLPYYSLNSTGASSTFSFFSGNQPHLNLSLFHNPHRAIHVDCFGKSLKTKESTSASWSIDFHPLLQRTDSANSDLVTACSTAHLSAGLEGRSAQLHNHSAAVKTKSVVNSGPLATRSKPSSPNEKGNVLDLEIHLRSTSTNETAIESRDVAAHPMQSKLSVPNSENTMEAQNKNSSSYQHRENCPAVRSKLVSGAHASVIPSNNSSRCHTGDIGDQSNPEIVMEQEELSDSDEEIEEHVEFECEEMADSEGEEGSGCEQIAEMQDKEVPSFVTEKVLSDADCDDQQWKLRTPGHIQGNICVPRKNSSPFLKLGLSGLGKDTTSSSWLSLDSCAPGRPRSKTKHEESINEGTAAKVLATCRPNRFCKKTTPSTKKVTTQKHALDMAQQLSLGPLAVPTLRKPRKRACRTSSNLNIGMTTESSRCDGKN